MTETTTAPFTAEQLQALQTIAAPANDKGPSSRVRSITLIAQDGKSYRCEAVVWKDRDCVVSVSHFVAKDHADNVSNAPLTAAFCAEIGLDESETARAMAYRAACDALLIQVI
jgi:hypothetical protein